MKKKYLVRLLQRRQSVLAFFTLGLLCAGTAESLQAHGSMLDPVSRVYRIFLDNPQTPQNDAARAALAVNGTQPFYDWNEVSRNLPDYDWQANVPDGQLASGGRAKYAGLDLVRSDWAATAVESGPYRFVYHATTPHSPSYFRAFITKADWDPESALAWADFEPLPGAENAALQGNNYAWDTILPERQGRHVVLVIWQRIDPVGEVFFSVSDVVFGADNGYGGGAVTPGTVYQPEPEEPVGPCGQPLAQCHCNSDCYLEAAFTVVNSWSGGYVANVTVHNRGSTAVNGWSLSLDLEGQLVNWWSAILTETAGTRHTFSPEAWAQEIAAGGSVTFGLQINGDPSAGAANIAVNGVTSGGQVDTGGNLGGEPPNTSPDPGVDIPPDEAESLSTARTPVRQSVVAYFPSWGIYEKGYEVADLPAGRLTHVIHAFARISPEGEMAVIDPWADLERAIGPDRWDTPLRGNFGAYARLKAAHPHLRVLIAVGGWFDSGRFSEVAATPAARAKFAASVRAFCLQYGFDGVDLDWEYPVVATDVNRNVRPEDGENYALLAGAIRAEFDAQSALDGRRYEITAAMPAGFDKFERINLAALAAQLDLINLMTYDFHGRWIATQTGHNAPLFRSAMDPNPRYNTDEAVRGYLAAGVPAAKIALGIPAYGYGWQGVASPVPFSSASGVGPGTLSVEPGFYDYRTVAALVRDNPGAERWDEAAEASYFYHGDLWIGYDSPRALRRKLEYVRDLGLGGVMFWEASTDVRADGADSLIRVASEALSQPSTWQEWTERWWSVEERLNPQLAGEEADPDGDGLLNLLEYAAGRDPLVADGGSVLVARWDGESGRFVVRFDKSPGVSDLAYGFEAKNGSLGGESWSNVSLEVLTDNEAVLEAADVSVPTAAGSRMIRLRVTRQ
jgi:chitinase